MTNYLDPDASYKIIRGYRDSDKRETIETGLTLEEAQAHVKDKETSSSTCKGNEGLLRTEQYGPWFDRMEEE